MKHCGGYVAKNPKDICWSCDRCVSDSVKNVIKYRKTPIGNLSPREFLKFVVSVNLCMFNLTNKQMNNLVRYGKYEKTN